MILLFAPKSKDCNCLSVIERGTNYNSYKVCLWGILTLSVTVTSYQLPGKVLDSFVSFADFNRSLFPLDERAPSFLFCEFNSICVYCSFP